MYRKTSDPITVWVHFSLIKSGGRRRGRPTAAPKHTLSPPQNPREATKEHYSLLNADISVSKWPPLQSGGRRNRGNLHPGLKTG